MAVLSHPLQKAVVISSCTYQQADRNGKHDLGRLMQYCTVSLHEADLFVTEHQLCRLSMRTCLQRHGHFGLQ